jgi:hypothetical protein
MMKSILITIVFLALAVSGLAQTRSVIVNTSGVVQSPTNFWSADVVNARSGLGLGTAATNPATAFQPSSLALSNLASNNGGALTNVTATSFSGTVGLASNVTGTIAISNGGSGATTAGSARTNFGLGWSALTNPQSSLYSGTATTLLGYTTEIIAGGTNLSGFNVLAYTSANGLVIPANLLIGEDQAPAPRNLRHVEIRGTATIGNPFTDDTIFGANYASVTDQLTFTNSIATWNSNAVTMDMPIAFSTNTAAATTRTNLGLGLSALTNTNTTNFRTAIGLGAGSTNEVGFGSVKMGGFGVNFIEPVNQDIVISLSGNEESVYLNPIYWNDGGVRTALGLGLSVLTNTNVSNFRTAIGLGVTNDVTFGSVTAPSIKDSSGTRALDLENFALTFGTNYVLEWSATEAQFNKPLVFFGTNTAATTRTNLGLGSTWLTNTNVTNFRTAIGLGASSSVQFDAITTASIGVGVGATSRFTVDESMIEVTLPIEFSSGSAAGTRTNIGLGWSALTNSNAGTGLVSVSTNGEVVSPTNFWQVAPIVTKFVEFDPPTNATTNIVAARNLHIHSLAISRVGVTSTIALPITNSFDGDIALVVHQGPTSSVTAVRTAGAATNLVTMNRPEEAVEFVYYNNVWQFNHNRSFVEPVYFSGTSAASHAAESRTNLGLGGGITTNLVLKNSANQDTYLNFSNGILKYGSITPP